LYGDVTVRWGHGQDYYDQAAWRGTWAQDGGALMNQSIHAMDLMTWLLGSPVREVSGWIGQLAHRMEAEDFGLAILSLENGGVCQVEGTTCTDPGRQEAAFTIIGTEGEIRCGILKGKPNVRILDRQGHDLTWRYLRRFVGQQWRQGSLRSLLQLKNPHSGLYRDMIRAIREKRAPLADGMSGRQAIELVLAIYQSALLKKTVILPLQNFTIKEMSDFFARDIPSRH
jgi:UDP-N-acetyl-2-amino-2-deoxyglucuronate dehydrogenase